MGEKKEEWRDEEEGKDGREEEKEEIKSRRRGGKREAVGREGNKKRGRGRKKNRKGSVGDLFLGLHTANTKHQRQDCWACHRQQHHLLLTPGCCPHCHHQRLPQFPRGSPSIQLHAPRLDLYITSVKKVCI